MLDPRIGSFRPGCLAAIRFRWLVFGNDPDLHHAAMLVGHVFNAALVGVVARRLGLSPRRSAFAAALFALAPLRLDAALNLHAGCDLLVTPLCLLFLLAWRARPGLPAVIAACAAAAVAVTIKETGFVMVATVALLSEVDTGDALRIRRPERPWRLAALGGVLAALFLVRWIVLDGVAGAYAEGLWRGGPGLRGVLAGGLATIVPLREVLDLSEWSRGLLPASLRRYVLVGVALAAGVALVTVVARTRPTRAKRMGVALLLAACVPFLFSVNERSAYLAGVGACIVAAGLPLPERAIRVVPALLIAGLVVLCALRWIVWLEASSIANGVRSQALALASEEGASTVYLLGSPDELAGTRSSPHSECYVLLEPSAIQVRPVLRGHSSDGSGVRFEDRTLAPEPGFQFLDAYCRGFDDGVPDLDYEVRCADGAPEAITVTAPPGTLLLVWSGGERVERMP